MPWTTACRDERSTIQGSEGCLFHVLISARSMFDDHACSELRLILPLGDQDARATFYFGKKHEDTWITQRVASLPSERCVRYNPRQQRSERSCTGGYSRYCGVEDCLTESCSQFVPKSQFTLVHVQIASLLITAVVSASACDEYLEW